MKLLKMHGAGNDFLFLNLLDQVTESNQVPTTPEDRSQWVQKVCNRHFGVGADGLAFLEPHSDYAFGWDFYNSDGSHAEMCGNAARCAALLYSQSLASPDSEFEFLTASGPVEAKVLSNQEVCLSTMPVKVLQKNLDFKSSQGMHWQAMLVDSGVPHAVVNLAKDSDLLSEPNKAACSELRSHSSVGSKGANVTLYKDVSAQSIQAVSFERGVEDFTLACGTGVIAAAFVKNQREKCDEIHVSVPGGELRVDFRSEKPKLIGPAKRIASIELDIEF